MAESSKKLTTQELIAEALQNNFEGNKGVSVISLKRYLIEQNPAIDNNGFNTRFNKSIISMLEKEIIDRPRGSEDQKGATGKIRLKTKNTKTEEKQKRKAPTNGEEKVPPKPKTKKVQAPKDEMETSEALPMKAPEEPTPISEEAQPSDMIPKKKGRQALKKVDIENNAGPSKVAGTKEIKKNEALKKGAEPPEMDDIVLEIQEEIVKKDVPKKAGKRKVADGKEPKPAVVKAKDKLPSEDVGDTAKPVRGRKAAAKKN